MTDVSVQDISPELTETLLGGEISDEIFNTIGPTGKAAPDKGTDPKPAEPKPAEPKPEASKDFLSPDDLRAPKPAEPPGVPSDEEVERTFGQDAKQKEAFIHVKRQLKDALEKARNLEEKVAQGQVSEAAVTERDEAREKLTQAEAKAQALEAELGKLDLTRSPDFKKQYDDRLTVLGQKMVSTISEEGVDANEAVALVRQVLGENKPSARERIIDDSVPGLKGTILALAHQYEETLQTRQAALDKWKETSLAMEETSMRSKVAELTSKVDEVTGAAIDEVRNLGNAYYVETKDAEWNAEVQTRVSQVKGVLVSGDFSKIAPLVAEGLTAAPLRARYVGLLNEYKKVAADLDAALKGAPRPGSGRPSDSLPVRPSQSDNGEPLEDQITHMILPGR